MTNDLNKIKNKILPVLIKYRVSKSSLPSAKKVKKMILKMAGKPCPDFEPACYVCRMWRAFESYCWLIEEIQREQKEK